MKQLTLLIVLGSMTAAVVADPAVVSYPEGYRNWTHVKSMVIAEGHPLYESFGGIHHLYANEKALDGYQSGEFPNDAVIVFDLLSAVTDNNATTEGERKVVGVMAKDDKKFSATGGWGFEAFAAGVAEQPVVKESAPTACFQCHIAQRQQDYVFSAWRE